MRFFNLSQFSISHLPSRSNAHSPPSLQLLYCLCIYTNQNTRDAISSKLIKHLLPALDNPSDPANQSTLLILLNDVCHLFGLEKIGAAAARTRAHVATVRDPGVSEFARRWVHFPVTLQQQIEWIHSKGAESCFVAPNMYALYKGGWQLIWWQLGCNLAGVLK